MKKKLYVEVCYKGIITVESPDDEFDQFVDSTLPELGLYGGTGVGTEGSYSADPFHFVSSKIIETEIIPDD